MKKAILLWVLFFSLQHNPLQAQGPPITGDKPIMLGAKRVVLKTLTELRKTDNGFYQGIPLMVHYLPTSNLLVGVHFPLVHYNLNAIEKNEFHIGDVQLLAKYQFYKKDQTGKTFRMVAKTLQTIPTGKKIDFGGFSTGLYQGYLGIVAGLETIKYGVSHEIGFNTFSKGNQNELRHKLGFGLPLFKPSYPVNQLNLYFEYQSSWFPKITEYQLFYAQGIQYAKGQFTWEASIQFPLIQNISELAKRSYSILLGTRYVF